MLTHNEKNWFLTLIVVCNEKNWSLTLIVVCKVLTVFVTFWDQYKIIGKMLSTFYSSNVITIGQVLWMYLYWSQNIF